VSIIKLKSTDGTPVEYDPDKPAGSGGMKDVFFSPDRKYVIGWFRKPLDANSQDRLDTIVGTYRTKILEEPGGEYWRNLFCWPTHVVKEGGRTGVVTPTYQPHYFFEFGSLNNDMLSIRGKEKEGKWFASANHRKKFLRPEELGHWRSHIRVSLLIARAVRRLHAAGLAHSDLSYKNVLIDPRGGNACIIDIDGLVVPNKFPPDVVGTPDFIAPEVMSTLKLPVTDPKRRLPCIETDRHALAVLIYMYLLYRHPLRGGKIHDQDPARDEELMMGEKAQFVEHPTDHSNRVNAADLKPSEMPYGDPARLPYSATGPYLKELFDKAFITGLHTPHLRPTADDWERALVKTDDLVLPCANKACPQQWFPFDNTMKPNCPFCGTRYSTPLPVLNLYSCRSGKFYPDNHRLMVYDQRTIHSWHVWRHIVPGERLATEQKPPVADFQIVAGRWHLINRKLPAMRDVSADKPIPAGTMVELRDGQQILLSPDEGGRLIHVQMSNI
jgi:serine/threonine protein kinase